jgi:ABC-type dipeptide/oligopeptide/nickel transport system permease component
MRGRKYWKPGLGLAHQRACIYISYYVGILDWYMEWKKEGRIGEQLLSLLLFAIFAIPSFWLATLILLFSSGEWLTLLPSGGLGSYHTASGFMKNVESLLLT